MSRRKVLQAVAIAFAMLSPAMSAAQTLDQQLEAQLTEEQDQRLAPNERINLGNRQVELDNGNWVDCNGDCSQAKVYAFWQNAGDIEH